MDNSRFIFGESARRLWNPVTRKKLLRFDPSELSLDDPSHFPFLRRTSQFLILFLVSLLLRLGIFDGPDHGLADVQVSFLDIFAAKKKI